MLTPSSLKSPRRLFTAGLTVIVSAVAMLVLAGASQALALNEAQLDNGTCGQVLNNGAIPTLTRSRTPSFLLAGDGGLASYSIFIDGAPLGTFSSDGWGNVCIYTTVPLSDGPHRLTGNELTPHSYHTVVPFDFGVDATPPASPSTPVLSPLRDSGTLGDNITNKNPIFTGTAEPNITMQVYEGPSLAGGAKADANGLWSVTTLSMSDGTYSMTSAAFDTAGNKSALSAPMLLTIDKTPPPVPPLPALDPASDSGVIGDNVTSVLTPTVTGTTSGGARTVTVFRDGVQAGTTIPDAAGGWRFTLPAQTLGAHLITVKATDVADNASVLSSALSLTIVAGLSPSAPSAPTLNSATGGNAFVSLAWSAPASDGGSPITGYKIYRGTTSGGETLLTTVGTGTSWTDTNVGNGITYFYQVSATNFVGEGVRSAERFATPSAPVTVPGAPNLSAATAGNGTVGLSWTTPANGGSAITWYRIYRGTWSGGETLLATLGAATNSWTDTGVTNGTTYYYQVSASNSVGEGSRSNERSATPAAPVTVPGAPTLSSATAGNASVTLNWTTPANGGSAITWYRIYRGTWSGGETLLATLGAATNSWTDTGVTNGTTYYYQVSASNSVGEGSRSNERSATPAAPVTVPGAPTLSSATAGNASVTLNWTTPANGGSAITWYRIYRGTWSGGETLLATLGAATNSWTDTGVTNGTTYYYQVSASNSVGEGSRSNERSATPTASATAPGAPNLTAATAGNGTVGLAWTTPANGGSAITGYKIYRGTWSGGETLLTTVGVLTGWTDFNAANGTTYYYQVSASNSVGEGSRSNERSATPAAPVTVPGAPTLSSATAGNASVTLNWTTPANGGSAITWYRIYRGTWSGGETLLATLGAATNSWTDTGVTNGTTYYYQVSASNSVGEGSRSNERSATPTASATAPGAPNLTAATAGNGTVGLAWTTPANGGSAITGYKIYRGTWSGGETLLTTVGVLTGWTDFNAANGTTYYYQVSATNAVGEGARSNERSATPAASVTVPGAPTLNSATAGNASVTLSWTTPANGGSAITGYKIYRGTWSGGETLLTTVGVLTGWTDFNAANGTTYYYQVSATNTVGEGARSNERFATPAAPDPTPPSKPASLKALLEGTTQIIVDWPAATDNVAVTGYKVYRNSVFVALVQTTWFNDSGLTPGVTYSYFVKAVDAAGNESLQSSSDSLRTVSLSTSTTGTLSGVVFNGAGTPIANVVASFRLPNGTLKSTKSNNNGEWKFSNLPPGTYAVSFARTGSPTTTLNLTAQAGRTILAAVVTTP